MPLEVHSASHTNVLDKIIASGAGLGSLKFSVQEKNLVRIFLCRWKFPTQARLMVGLGR